MTKWLTIAKGEPDKFTCKRWIIVGHTRITFCRITLNPDVHTIKCWFNRLYFFERFLMHLLCVNVIWTENQSLWETEYYGDIKLVSPSSMRLVLMIKSSLTNSVTYTFSKTRKLNDEFSQALFIQYIRTTKCLALPAWLVQIKHQFQKTVQPCRINGRLC